MNIKIEPNTNSSIMAFTQVQDKAFNVHSMEDFKQLVGKMREHKPKLNNFLLGSPHTM